MELHPPKRTPRPPVNRSVAVSAFVVLLPCSCHGSILRPNALLCEAIEILSPVAQTTIRDLDTRDAEGVERAGADTQVEGSVVAAQERRQGSGHEFLQVGAQQHAETG